MSIFPKSDSAHVYATLVTIPAIGSITGMIVYEVLGANSLLVDIMMVSSAATGIYSTSAIAFKIGRLFILRRWESGWKSVKTTTLAILANAMLFGIYWAKLVIF